MAQLNGSIAAWSSAVTLSTEGNLDWASWGPESGTALEFNSKSGGSPEISTATAVNCVEAAVLGDTQPLRSWTGGTPNASRTNTNAMHYFGSDDGDGFTFTVPADTTARRLKVYLSVFEATANVTVSLSDASASNYTVNWSGTDPAVDRIVTVDFAAGSGGQTLTVQVLLTGSAGGVIGLLAATLSTPTFSSAPALSSETATAFTDSYTASFAGDVIWGGLYLKDAAAPTAAQLKAGTGARGVATETTTGSADSIVLTPTDSPPFPIYDRYYVLERGTGVFGTVMSILDGQLDAPAGYQHVTIDISGGAEGILVGAGSATGDILQISTVTSPGGYAWTQDADGSWEYDADGDTSRQSVQAWFYDVSAGAWSDAARVTIYVNNSPPELVPGLHVPVELSVLEDVAIATVNLSDYGQDDDGDALDVTNTGAYATGLSESANLLTGTPTTPGITRNVITLTDIAGDTVTFDFAMIIRPARPLFTGVVSNLTLINSSPMTTVDFSTKFTHDTNPDPAMTFTLKQIGSASVVTTAVGSSTFGTALTVASAAAISVGGYISTETNSTKVLVLAKYGNTLELATATAWLNGDDISYSAVSDGAPTGLTQDADGTLGGTPTVSGVSSWFSRASDGTYIKDSPLFTITVLALQVVTFRFEMS